MNKQHYWIAAALSIVARVGDHAVESSAARTFPGHGFRASERQVRQAGICLSYRRGRATFGGNDIELVRIGLGLAHKRYPAALINIGVDPVTVAGHDAAEI